MTLSRLLTIALLFCAASDARSARPNVLFITVDDMNCDSVGAFGGTVKNITPNIDRLAKEGMRFEHAHVTIAICQPTRAVWMTGRYPHRNGALGFDPIRRNVPTLLESLKGHGYYTGILAKVNHVVPTRKAAWDMIVPGNRLMTGREPQLYQKHCASFFAAAKKAGKPFFLMANSQDPHRPFAGSQQEKNRKQRRKKNRKPPLLPGFSRKITRAEVTVPGFLPKLRPVHREVAEYYTSVHRADQIVGAVLRALDQSGMRDNTIVLFMSDHGMALPFAKTNCWYHSTRTPWIVRWPKVVRANSADTKHLISGIDVTPTILNAAGLPPLPGVDGKTIVPLLKGRTQKGREFVFTQINRTSARRAYPMRSVQNARYGYIFNAWSNGKTRFRNESQAGRTFRAMNRAAKSRPKIAERVKHYLFRTKEEFYDYQKDPDALHNLIDDPKYQKMIIEFRARLKKQMKDTGDHVLRDFERHLTS